MPAACVRSRKVGEVRLDFLPIFLLAVIGRDLKLRVGLHVDQDGRAVHFGRTSSGSRTWNRTTSLP
jgi:hypothetical protein